MVYEVLRISMQQQLFLNSISIGLRGKLESNGSIYAIPLPVIVCLAVNDVLFDHNVNDTIPVFSGITRILFLTINGIEIIGCITCVMHNLAMLAIVPWMFFLKLSHRDILSHTLMPLSELSGGSILTVFQAKSDI